MKRNCLVRLRCDWNFQLNYMTCMLLLHILLMMIRK